MPIKIIAFDADDTLWENEIIYTRAQRKLERLLARYLAPEDLTDRLYATESQNIAFYGYGIKSFTLSMIETAITLSEGQIQASEIEQIIGFGKEMLQADIQLLPHAAETVRQLSQSFPLMLITKGDLLDQQRKLERSGLRQFFQVVEVVSEKRPEDYRHLLDKHHIRPEHFLMVGNSLRSDVLPVVGIGGYAVYVPYEHTWIHEHIQLPNPTGESYIELENLGQLPAYITTQLHG